jgi:hypothetical protein
MTYVLSMIFLGLAILLGFIAVFVPWAQKDIAVGSRAYAAPFKTCIANTFSTVNEQLCLDNDFIKKGGAPLTQGTVCAAYARNSHSCLDFLARLRHQHMQAKQHLPNQQLFLWVRAVHFCHIVCCSRLCSRFYWIFAAEKIPTNPRDC